MLFYLYFTYTTLGIEGIQCWKRMEEWNDGTIFSSRWDSHAYIQSSVVFTGRFHSHTQEHGVKSLSSNLYDGLNNYPAFSAQFVDESANAVSVPVTFIRVTFTCRFCTCDVLCTWLTCGFIILSFVFMSFILLLLQT